MEDEHATIWEEVREAEDDAVAAAQAKAAAWSLNRVLRDLRQLVASAARRKKRRGRGRGEGDDSEPLLPPAESGVDAGRRAPHSDEALIDIYAFHRARGFRPWLVRRVANLVGLAFTITLCFVLWLLVDWPTLVTRCSSEATCSELDVFTMRHIHEPGALTWCVYTFTAVTSAYLLWFLLTLPADVLAHWRMRRFYNTVLHIDDVEVQTTPWATVAARLCSSSDYGTGGTDGTDGTRRARQASDLAARIMRTENYLVALVDQSVLGSNTRMSQVLEWNLRLGLLHPMMDDERRLRATFVSDVKGLRRRFRVIAFLNLVLMPFILLFSATFFFLKNAEQLHTSRDYLGPARWTTHARWQLRGYNELPHTLDRRLHKAEPLAREYMRQFPSPVVSTLAQLVAFVSGALVAVLLLLTLVDEDILLFVHLWPDSPNLIWFLAVCSGALHLSRGASQEDGAAQFEPRAKMRPLRHLLRHAPRHWRTQAHSYATRDEVASMFKPAVAQFLDEMRAVVRAPWLLLTRVQADVLSKFILEWSVDSEHLGALLTKSLFGRSRRDDKDEREEMNTSISLLLPPLEAGDDDDDPPRSLEDIELQLRSLCFDHLRDDDEDGCEDRCARSESMFLREHKHADVRSTGSH